MTCGVVQVLPHLDRAHALLDASTKAHQPTAAVAVAVVTVLVAAVVAAAALGSVLP